MNLSNPLFTLSVNDFSDLVRNLVQEELGKINPKTSSDSPTSNVQLNFEQAAKYLKLSKPTFSKLRKKGEIQSYQVSENRVLFLKEDLDSYIKNKKMF